MRARITPAEILEAYEKTGFIPKQGSWLEEIDGPNNCACGLTAMVYTVDPTIPASYWGRRGFWLCEQYLELDRWYAEGFIDGFDSETDPDWEIDWDPAYLRGLEDGKAAWLAVRHLAAGEDK